jgi:hypothetical protein
MMKIVLVLVTILASLSLSLPGRPVSAVEDSEVTFNRDIRPIFSDTCFRCHGPDKNARKAGLRLDIREEATKKRPSGVIPIVPGHPESSEIIRRINATNEAEIMPPAMAHKTLSDRQKEIIKRWVASGAKYEGHWAYQPIVRPVAPAAGNPIDAFVQARLAKERLASSPEADPRILIRRVTLDLTGIPPTPGEVTAFINDKSPDAYTRLVDRLLASPRYAEMQTMRWLDAMRYADSAGFHGDNLLPAWPYRDYVLEAFLHNKPFDEFTREQIAGDLIPNATAEQKVASAYNRLNRTSAEGGLQPSEYLAKYAADRVRTTSIVWLGATLGCAECHDHKFDPYLSKDFYSMKAFFADIKETGLVADRGDDAFGSKLRMPSDEQQKRLDELNREVKWVRTEIDNKAETLKPQRADWEKRILELHKTGKLGWRFQQPISASAAHGAQLKIYNDDPLTVTVYRRGNLITESIKGNGLVVAGGPNPDNETYTVTFRPGPGEWTALGIQVVQDESLPADRFGRGGDRFVLTEVETEANGRRVEFSLATTDKFGEQFDHPPMAAIDGNPKTGWAVIYGDGRDAFLALRFSRKLQTSSDTAITVKLHHDSTYRQATIGRFRLALSSDSYSWPDHASGTIRGLGGLPVDMFAALKTPEEQRTANQKKIILEYFNWAAPELQSLNSRAARLECERDILASQVPRVVITESTTPRETRILPRGNFLDESGEVVQPAVPVVFGTVKTGLHRATRLDLANWITSRDNTLTARVFANRTWRQFFGTGISRTLDDLGSQGEWPVHPELLDWLASEFMHPTWDTRGAHDWDVRHLIRTIVLSHTYRQSSLSNQQLDERDPDNRLLARQSRFRVDAEIVHDIALSVSGLLVEKLGGPSVRPYQPEGYLLTLNFPKRDYSAGHGDELYRRGIYTQWQRTFLHPSLSAFDAPSREECTVNRVNSNTPLQALVLLDDPIYVEAARVFAQNTLKQGGLNAQTQVSWAFDRALGRKPRPDELAVLTDLHRKALTRFVGNPNEARRFVTIGDAPLGRETNVARLAAMMSVTRAILNLHETITRN